MSRGAIAQWVGGGGEAVRQRVVEEFLKRSEADQLRIASGTLQELQTDLNAWPSTSAQNAVLETYLVHGDNEMDEKYMGYLPENYLRVWRNMTAYLDLAPVRSATGVPDEAPGDLSSFIGCREAEE